MGKWDRIRGKSPPPPAWLSTESTGGHFLHSPDVLGQLIFLIKVHGVFQGIEEMEKSQKHNCDLKFGFRGTADSLSNDRLLGQGFNLPGLVR